MRGGGHLIRRFLGALAAKRLGPREQSEVAALLRHSERTLFWDQPFIDQRHALRGARRVLAARPGDRAVARAALLHDVGKRHAGLGVLGRSMASGLGLFGIRPARWQSYYDHGAIGAAELGETGAAELVTEWARSHSVGRRPQSISPADWESLRDADRS